MNAMFLMRMGYRIPRREAVIDESVNTAGMLFHLNDLDELFTSNNGNST